MDDPLEQRLRQALEPKEPSEGFAARVMVRVAQAEAREWHRLPARGHRLKACAAWLFRPAWRMTLAGAMAGLLLLGGGFIYQRHEQRLRAETERLQAEKARAELMLALEITSQKLNQVRQVLVSDMRQSRDLRQ